MGPTFVILTYHDSDRKLMKQASEIKKVITLDNGYTRVWFHDGEGLDCKETPEQIAGQIKYWSIS